MANQDSSLDARKRVRMFAGPNGSGKTSLVQKLSRDYSDDGLFQLYHFINADEIHQALLDGQPVSASFLDRAVDTHKLRKSLVAGQRLPVDHPFIATVELTDVGIVAPSGSIDGYAAAAIADFFREQMLANGQSFSFETVMSHPSKVEFLARAESLGYRTYLYFVATESAQLNVYRVQNRMHLAGTSFRKKKSSIAINDV